MLITAFYCKQYVITEKDLEMYHQTPQQILHEWSALYEQYLQSNLLSSSDNFTAFWQERAPTVLQSGNVALTIKQFIAAKKVFEEGLIAAHTLPLNTLHQPLLRQIFYTLCRGNEGLSSKLEAQKPFIEIEELKHLKRESFFTHYGQDAGAFFMHYLYTFNVRNLPAAVNERIKINMVSALKAFYTDSITRILFYLKIGDKEQKLGPDFQGLIFYLMKTVSISLKKKDLASHFLKEVQSSFSQTLNALYLDKDKDDLNIFSSQQLQLLLDEKLLPKELLEEFKPLLEMEEIPLLSGLIRWHVIQAVLVMNQVSVAQMTKDLYFEIYRRLQEKNIAYEVGIISKKSVFIFSDSLQLKEITSDYEMYIPAEIPDQGLVTALSDKKSFKQILGHNQASTIFYDTTEQAGQMSVEIKPFKKMRLNPEACLLFIDALQGSSQKREAKILLPLSHVEEEAYFLADNIPCFMQDLDDWLVISKIL
jgi:hypothetical protein